MQKILLIRVGQLGDMVMITPALDALLERYPEATVAVLTSADGKRLLQRYHPRMGEGHVYNRRSWLPWREKRRIRQWIRNQQFDFIVCLETKASFAQLYADTSARSVTLPADEPTPVVHYAQRCLDLVAPQRDRFYPVHVPVSDAGLAQSNALFAEHGIGPDDLVIGFHPSFSHLGKGRRGRAVAHHKFWPVASWGALAIALREYATQQQRKLHIVMDLLPEDRALGEEIVNAARGGITMWIPPLHFERYTATLARFDIFICPDTGPMHLAAAVGTNVVALFSGKDPLDCGPYVAEDKRILLRAECSTHPELGLAGITPAAVMEAVKIWI
ncbi:MAG: glycosyltransferase family 9 protein [Pseudomonadota bacterium]